MRTLIRTSKCWQDIDFTAKKVAITGKVNRIPGQGMIRENFTKSAAGERVLPLPAFAINMLMSRQVSAVGNVHDVVFPSTQGTLTDPSAVHKQWRTVRAALKMDWVTSNTFRKTLVTPYWTIKTCLPALGRISSDTPRSR